jgi:phosphatidylserine/phosphatidylglycerophosphate/cardiolipin synthase-like enzyme
MHFFYRVRLIVGFCFKFKEIFMRAKATKNGLTLQIIVGTQNAIIGMDLADEQRKDCLGFSIHRTSFGPVADPFPTPDTRWLPNMLRFPSDTDTGAITTETAPLQKFRWGDYTLRPASRYKFRVVPRYGKPGALTPDPEADPDAGIELEVTTEDKTMPETSVHFNRGAAASRAFELKFGDLVNEAAVLADTAQGAKARAWLSNGLEEAILAFLAQAKDDSFALHAAIYEFQKTNLVGGLKAAQDRGAEVKVAYHHRQKNAKDKTAPENDEAAEKAGFKPGTCVQRGANPQNAIMHNKFVVLLQKDAAGKLKPKAVWTGSTNWTDGGIYGQLNVGHAIYNDAVAETYEKYFELLFANSDAKTMKSTLATLSPVPDYPAENSIVPILSPQADDDMLKLYAKICDKSKCLMVSAPFQLAQNIRDELFEKEGGEIRFLLVDKTGSLGDQQEIQVIEGDPDNSISVATTLSSPLHDFQGQLLEGKEGFHHAGIHIHSKIIIADPFGDDPVVVTGSANFSNNSTETNDSNTVVFRGFTKIADIYAVEFMRMFEHYHFRALEAKSKDKNKPMGLDEDDSWSDGYYVEGSQAERDRKTFAGTMEE